MALPRRMSLIVLRPAGEATQCELDRIDDPEIPGASAEVAVELLTDALAARARQAAHDIVRGCEHAGGTEPALQGVALREALADDVHDRVVAIALNRAHVGTVRGDREHDTGSDRLPVHQQRAGAADAVL